jgi:hypothetical protein
MQLENIPEFLGTQEDTTQPSDFLKLVKCLFLTSRTTADDQKIDLFGLYSKSDSPAEDWFNNARMTKKMWLKLKKDFKVRFPNIKKAMKTALELECELRSMRITMEELGKTERFRGEEVYTHMVFAEKILDLVR